MIVISSATSNTGGAVAEALLAHDQQIRVLGRNRDRLRALEERGAEAFVLDNTDPVAMREAFADAEAAFLMIAPGLIPTSTDYAAYQRKVIGAFREALAGAPDLERVVTLSGWAANFDGARGPVWGLRRLEEAVDSLETLSDADVVHLRAGWFMENALPMIDEVRTTGVARGVIPPDLPLPAVATSDIGAVAADLLTGARSVGGRVLELHGPRDMTLREVTSVIGDAVGQPHADYERIEVDTMRETLLAAGFSAHVAEGVVAMTLDVAEGRITMLQARSSETETPTTLGEFLAPFVAEDAEALRPSGGSLPRR